MDPFTPLDQSNTSFTSPITDFNMNDWVNEAHDWNTSYNIDAFPVAQPSGFANQEAGDGFRLGPYMAPPCCDTPHCTHEATQPDLPGSYRQRQAELSTFNNTPTIIDHFGTGDPGPTIDPIRFEHVPVGFTDPYRTNMFDSDKTETSEPGQGSFSPAWADSTVPDNSDGKNSALSANTTSAAPGSSRECSCITCVDLSSERDWSLEPFPAQYPCRLADCNFSTAVGSGAGLYLYGFLAELDARKHEKNHFRHEGQFRCIEDRCVYGAKRWSDLKRHYTSKHCLNPKTKFPCPEIGCKYSGNNGFTRKDKLKSHREKVHEKVAKPGKQFRASKSNVQGAT